MQPRRCPKCYQIMPLARRKCPYCRTQLSFGEETRSIEVLFLEEQLSGRFEIVSEINRKGISTVFLAHDLLLERRVAIKALNLGEIQNEKLYQIWELNAKRSLRLDHVNTVRNFTFGQAGPLRFFISDYIPGGTLSERLKSNNRPRLWEVLRIARDVAKGLHAAHNLGISHHRLSITNITKPVDGFVQIFDFGSSQDVMDALEGNPASPDSQRLAYLAPEQIESGISDSLSDQYSLGLIIYQMLAGEFPFPMIGEESAMARLTGDMPPLRELNPGVPKTLEHIVNQTLARQPEYRYPSCRELAQALESLDPELWLPDKPEIGDMPRDKVIERLLHKAKLSEESRDYRRAILLCEQALVYAPYDSSVTELLARLRRKLELASEVQLLINKGLSAFYEQKLDIALSVLSKARSMDKSNPGIMRLTHEILQEQERNRLAKVMLQAARLDLNQKDLTQAMAKIVRILEVDPGNSKALELRREIESEMEDKATASLLIAQAEDAFRQVNVPKAERLLVEVLKLDHNNREARKLQAKIEERKRREKILNLKASLEKQFQTHAYKDAIHTLHEISILDPALTEEIRNKIDQIKEFLSKSMNKDKERLLIETQLPSVAPVAGPVEFAPDLPLERAESAGNGTPLPEGTSKDEPDAPGTVPFEAEQPTRKLHAISRTARKPGKPVVPEPGNDEPVPAQDTGTHEPELPVPAIKPEPAVEKPRGSPPASPPFPAAAKLPPTPDPVRANGEMQASPPATQPPADPDTPPPSEYSLVPDRKSTRFQRWTVPFLSMIAGMILITVIMKMCGSDPVPPPMEIPLTPTAAPTATPYSAAPPTEIPRYTVTPAPTIRQKPTRTPVLPTETPYSIQTEISELLKTAKMSEARGYYQLANRQYARVLNLERTNMDAQAGIARTQRWLNAQAPSRSAPTATPQPRKDNRKTAPTVTPKPVSQPDRKASDNLPEILGIRLSPSPARHFKELSIYISYTEPRRVDLIGMWFNYRLPDEEGFAQLKAERHRKYYVVTLPADAVKEPRILYFISALDSEGNEIVYASPAEPAEIPILH